MLTTYKGHIFEFFLRSVFFFFWFDSR